MDNRVSQESLKLLARMYRHYLTQRKAGVSKGVAMYMGPSWRIMSTIKPNCAMAALNDQCRELDRAGYLKASYLNSPSAEIYNSSLTDEAILLMERRFKDNDKSLASFIS